MVSRLFFAWASRKFILRRTEQELMKVGKGFEFHAADELCFSKMIRAFPCLKSGGVGLRDLSRLFLLGGYSSLPFSLLFYYSASLRGDCISTA